MDEESCEPHSEDDKALLEKNNKRTVKTRAQVQALEKFYDEHKYPTESLKIQLAESIGLTEKQVSGWFCHRRLKDKRLMNGENHGIGRPDRSSGVIQDRGSGHRQDSCGSTKLGDDKNLDTREVESGRVAHQDCSATELAYDRGGRHSGNRNRTDDGSSGSSSSLRNTPNSNNPNGPPFDLPSSRYLGPKAPMDVKGVKTRSGPSGYLKVKVQVENAAITAVKRQLGKHYREDGPPLGIEFDPVPPGAFESSMQEPVDETYYIGEAVLAASPDISKIHQRPNFDKGCEYNSSMGPHSSNMHATNFNTTQMSDIPNSFIHQKVRKNTSLSNNGAYYPWTNSVEGSARELSGSESREEYGMRNRHGVEVLRMDSISKDRHLQPYGEKVRGERDNRFHKYNDVSTKISRGENIENEYFNLSTKNYEYHNSLDKVLHREAKKDGRAYAERRMVTENRVRFPSKNDTAAPKRTRDEFPQQRHLKRLSVTDNQPGACRVIRCAGQMPSSFTEDGQSAETSSSVD
ncbi:hypothetical protein BUALT_Bualt02G0178600 [Buddleja alternifolia]|uniref:Homeobox domain-containing protein n=1 Tax=Buddleja alternifolia TaxID=168488 RepID=A0AAV6YC64_9LAMI|nr:hypothetical protein BUALT_Bualt02G0178600 [Buddleja alternifolia]